MNSLNKNITKAENILNQKVDWSFYPEKMVEYLGKEIHLCVPAYLDLQEVYIYKDGKRFNFTLTQQKDE